MRYEITAPDGKRFEVIAPDGATEAEVLAYAQQSFAPPSKPLDPTEGMSTGEKALAGVGKGFVDLGRGAGQMLGLVSDKDVADARKYDAPLMNTGAGVAGNVLGTLVAAAPTLAIPGANTVGGAALTGAVLNALQPVGEGESRLKNAAMGGAIGGGAQAAIGKLAQVAGGRLANAEANAASEAAKNSVRDATLRASQDAGYVVPPSQSGGGALARIAEGISGKYKTNQAASIKNQNTTDRLARQALGLADDAPLTRETMQSVRDRAFQLGYEPVANAGAAETDVAFKHALDNIVKDYQGASRSFPGAVRNEIMERVDSVRTGAFDFGDALKMTQILRDESTKAFAQGDKALGLATKKTANAIEDQIERALEASGKDGAELLKNFRDARTLMAKAHNVEKALVEGGGSVNARVLGAALQKGKPLTGELKTIGAFANNFKDVARIPESGWANPITALDAFGAAGMAGMGAGPFSIALPAARMAARSAVLGPLQSSPNYAPSAVTRLSPEVLKLLEQYGGPLGPSIYAAQ